jgi:hypothetical protein
MSHLRPHKIAHAQRAPTARAGGVCASAFPPQGHAAPSCRWKQRRPRGRGGGAARARRRREREGHLRVRRPVGVRHVVADRDGIDAMQLIDTHKYTHTGARTHKGSCRTLAHPKQNTHARACAHTRTETPKLTPKCTRTNHAHRRTRAHITLTHSHALPRTYTDNHANVHTPSHALPPRAQTARAALPAGTRRSIKPQQTTGVRWWRR